MIKVKGNVFRIDTENTTYIFRRTKFGHLEHIYYGGSLDDGDSEEVLAQKLTIPIGSSVLYEESDNQYCLDNMCLEWSDNGRGDYRHSPTELRMPDGSFVSDFVYVSHDILEGSISMGMPSSIGGDETLKITLKDTTCNVTLNLYYTLYKKANVITRRVLLKNESKDPLIISRIMSMLIDLQGGNFNLFTLDGGWIKEANLHKRPVEYGMLVNSSTTGSSSNRHNPGLMLAMDNTSENSGDVYGFNLIYSGNHYSAVEKSGSHIVRVTLGINPHCFNWNLSQGESFESPEAVMTFSCEGFNKMSQNMHYFVNEHVVRGHWKNRERPVLLNNWEATFFDFNQSKLLHMAKDAKKLGVELFVLDDGWFGDRNNDKAGLGDYSPNLKKLPQGVKGFGEKLRGIGLDFGLWFEPEMVNKNSKLYKTHPEYALVHPNKKPILGRNQLVLDLCNGDVLDYIVKNVSTILDEADIRYVKWDMNRHIGEGYSPSLKNQGEFYHRYILGLYNVLSRIFGPRPNILLESCSSGGNRFDLGMLCFSPQIWCSDDTDPIERLKIQSGLSYFYPLSTMGAHVSSSPHQQTLRETPLATRFNVASFGCLGYELEFKYLSPEEKKDVKEQIAFYKKYRKIFQYGTFSRIETNKNNKVIWQSISKDKNTALTGFFQILGGPSESGDKLVVNGIKNGKYIIRTRPQRLYIDSFGNLIKHILPVNINSEGIIIKTLNRHYSLRDCTLEYKCSSKALAYGIPLCSKFSGTGYNEKVRMLGDFGSNIYITEKVEMEEKNNEK